LEKREKEASKKWEKEASEKREKELKEGKWMLIGKQPRPRPASGFYGVTANKKRWKAMIKYDGKQHSLGTFDTKQGAALAYDSKARQCGGDKLLNYESIAAAEAGVDCPLFYCLPDQDEDMYDEEGQEVDEDGGPLELSRC
jgi:hypothetical protein